jgi:hypothetical protein
LAHGIRVRLLVLSWLGQQPATPADAHPGRRSAEAEHHGDPAVRPVVYSTIACMTAFSKSRIS